MTGFARRSAADPLGAVLVAAGVAACAFLPFIVFKSNRILPGEPRALAGVLPHGQMLGLAASLGLAGLVALYAPKAIARFAAALLGITALSLAAAAAANALTPPGNLVVRIAPGPGFWVLGVALGLLATDAVTRLRPRPLVRVLLLVATLAAVLAALGSGEFDRLSIMREYAVHAARFWHEAGQHLRLAAGSLGVALLVALPLGVLCHRSPRLRAPVLAALNLIETIPAIALFGILMAPLAALAAAWPWLGHLGVHGVGAAPATVALFLYALLPITANTVAGLARVAPAAVDAARGMGMTPGQVLGRVELPLALPVILTGIRVVLVQNIGMVTVAALIGGGGLGTFVFQGIGQWAIDLVLLGAIPIVVLAFSGAVLLDALAESVDRVPA